MPYLKHDDRHQPHFRMPAGLGPASGPRNMPRDREHLRFDGDVTQIAIAVEVAEAALVNILPPGCSPLPGGQVEMQYMRLARLGWLAGRSYNVVALRIPVCFAAASGPLECAFMPVLWEDMADPILTGREELGSPKLYADIADPRRTGEWYLADIDQMTIGAIGSTPGAAPAPVVHERRAGTGRFRFHRPRWEDMPTQYTFVGALIDAGIGGEGPARLTRSSGMMDLAAQRIIV